MEGIEELTLDQCRMLADEGILRRRSLTYEDACYYYVVWIFSGFGKEIYLEEQFLKFNENEFQSVQTESRSSE